ncbi:MAG: hypothetical protein KME52_05135 [Desmonostoc geniculatum HA4340-LM1]|jgi:hypothetical protein|nr:hypothetical protein [Desmonostoc geniculatum HA4340-LM1]
MKIIKKSEKLTLKKMKEMEEAEDQILQGETVDFSELVVEEKPVIAPEYKEPNYIPLRDNPLVQSVGNSGWQPSDIWREMRVDSFYDG